MRRREFIGKRGGVPAPRPCAADADGGISQHGGAGGMGALPVVIPRSPVFVGPAMYMVGFPRGARDAGP
jgi:hypothetical protein